jgi:hypothetical protein
MVTCYKMMNGILGGVGLGMLSRSDLHAVSEIAYGDMGMYRNDDYNRSGLWTWEEDAIQAHFGGCRRILVAGAGGGREVLALRRRGLTADGFEAHPALVACANELLSREHPGDPIRQAAWDGCPEYATRFDGGIVGWGTYMHIRGSERRIAFLRQLRNQLETGAPLLLSFLGVKRHSRWMRLAAAIGTPLARVARGERVELGDWLEPDYKHHFTLDQMRRELAAGGFEMTAFSPGTGSLGSAIGIAVEHGQARAGAVPGPTRER